VRIVVVVVVTTWDRGELGILKKKHIGVHKDLEDQKTGIHSMQAEQTRLEIVIKGLEKDIAELKREIKGRDEAVLTKEKEVMDLKREVRSMDKYKFVLNHKIQLLENEIQPKNAKIAEMKQQILAMEEELTAVVKDQAEFNVQMNDSKAKLLSANQEVVVERRKVANP
jgi:chromosome segregation ATPase